MAQLVEHLPRTQDIAGSNPARGSSFLELSFGLVVYFALSLRMSLCVHVSHMLIGIWTFN